MAGTGTNVTTARMQETASKLQDQVSRYTTAVNKLYEIGTEIDAMWEGEASEKFAANLGNDREKFDALAKMINQYIATLQQNIQTYEKAENDALQTVTTRK